MHRPAATLCAARTRRVHFPRESLRAGPGRAGDRVRGCAGRRSEAVTVSAGGDPGLTRQHRAAGPKGPDRAAPGPARQSALRRRVGGSWVGYELLSETRGTLCAAPKTPRGAVGQPGAGPGKGHR